jgi:hypothetical protein
MSTAVTQFNAAVSAIKDIIQQKKAEMARLDVKRAVARLEWSLLQQRLNGGTGVVAFREDHMRDADGNAIDLHALKEAIDASELCTAEMEGDSLRVMLKQ